MRRCIEGAWASGPNTRGGREERTHSQAARTRAAFETQKIRRDSFVLQRNFVEAAGQTDSVTDMTLCVSVSWGNFKTEPAASHSLRGDRRPEHHLRLLLL